MPYFYMGYEMVSALVQRKAQSPPPTDIPYSPPVLATTSARVVPDGLPTKGRPAYQKPLSLLLRAVAYKLGALTLYVLATW
ncbi:hypothetical protein [Terriglobus saanensis]|uniref:Uncharacterized protein n=1 Tax=Terriglobus saanensis (strain ATCC BAA-1853 / DSM 23119 / SP1PR4) TaxID=401053 RepID=E8V7V9_TERSS|nr:hypothetical protein [Terriglobus saanensis]ADV82883.1 hypothetical protein AciPR4_2079 [Terriglobus saanensis SP1PR4]